MRYAQLLSNYIKKSGLNLAEISTLLKQKGITIDRSYISKLKSGTKPPASEDITRALAEVTGGDPDTLVNVGTTDKAPEEIKQFIANIENLLWDTIDYIVTKGDISQLLELISRIEQANLSSTYVGILTNKEERFNFGAIAERLSIFEIYGRDTFSLTDKLNLFNVVLRFYKDFNETPIEKILSEKDLQIHTIFGPMKLPTTSINMMITNGRKESLTEDEGEFLQRSLEVYRLQKAKWG
ncbi:hypothetical protein OB236_22375 [Paenibacillus sp. WQ 127069]|uniref:XRE family transcriptional regulator n=1 Tax=Paenibacillus baimaensis TaxID=2982185 RepID=A0ABT2UJS0_9BACL|nr:hypothetical protein [Paenibacillus sp. WQ 127069]MCU6794863.1 hypothetical protein [Paenibacillus sp. WQ 127069]